MSENITRDEFAGQLNSVFSVFFTPAKPREAELVNVGELNRRAFQESFSIVFHVPTDVYYEQNVYKVAHPVLGSFELFLVPVKQTVNGINYEAVFSRLTE